MPIKHHGLPPIPWTAGTETTTQIADKRRAEQEAIWATIPKVNPEKMQASDHPAIGELAAASLTLW